MAPVNKLVVALVVAAVAAASLLVASSEAAITCGQVGSSIAPCLQYATGKGPLTAGCCNAVRSLNNAASTSADRQAACRCLKSLAGSIKQLNMAAVAGIPGKCRVNVPFPLSLSTDCNNWVFPGIPGNPPGSAHASRIAVVTGGSKGIGLEVCRQLAGNGITVILTARDEKRGTEAVERLKGQGISDVLFHQLDITDVSSVAGLAGFLKTRFGRVDILVNNAACGGVDFLLDPVNSSVLSEEQLIGKDRDQRLEWLWRNSQETYDAAKKGLQTNYYGTKHVIEALLPLLQASSDGRMVNVSSDFGELRHFRNEELKQELNAVENITEERLDELLDMFLKDFEAGAVDARGWPAPFSAYKVAKAAMNAYSRILATKHPELRVNCVHPGYVKTDITLHSGLLTPEEGARNVVNVALLPEGGVTRRVL